MYSHDLRNHHKNPIIIMVLGNLENKGLLDVGDIGSNIVELCSGDQHYVLYDHAARCMGPFRYGSVTLVHGREYQSRRSQPLVSQPTAP